ncbi:hypothetical protein F4780DRAFT_150691 [Xylariomycetidae sp. FL0641]|nr:hypothetical protein F4780DRAFT_150691 [Xylariomycetidae sp. FL0641]
MSGFLSTHHHRARGPHLGLPAVLQGRRRPILFRVDVRAGPGTRPPVEPGRAGAGHRADGDGRRARAGRQLDSGGVRDGVSLGGVGGRGGERVVHEGKDGSARSTSTSSTSATAARGWRPRCRRPFRFHGIGQSARGGGRGPCAGREVPAEEVNRLGNTVLIPSTVQHSSPQAWGGANVAEFQHRRFVREPGTRTHDPAELRVDGDRGLCERASPALCHRAGGWLVGWLVGYAEAHAAFRLQRRDVEVKLVPWWHVFFSEPGKHVSVQSRAWPGLAWPGSRPEETVRGGARVWRRRAPVSWPTPRHSPPRHIGLNYSSICQHTTNAYLA